MSLLSLLDAERKHLSTSVDEVTAIADRYSHTAALFQALGGLVDGTDVNDRSEIYQIAAAKPHALLSAPRSHTATSSGHRVPLPDGRTGASQTPRRWVVRESSSKNTPDGALEIA